MLNSAIWAPRVLSLLRVVTALLFLQHGSMKLFQFPAAIPGAEHSLPTLLLVAGGIEIVAGVLMALGLLTRLAAFIASGEMAFAYFMVHAPQGFWPVLNSGESAVLFCFIFLCLAVAGGGAWALDNLLSASDKRESAPANA